MAKRRPSEPSLASAIAASVDVTEARKHDAVACCQDSVGLASPVRAALHGDGPGRGSAHRGGDTRCPGVGPGAKMVEEVDEDGGFWIADQGYSQFSRDPVGSDSIVLPEWSSNYNTKMK